MDQYSVEGGEEGEEQNITNRMRTGIYRSGVPECN